MVERHILDRQLEFITQLLFEIPNIISGRFVDTRIAYVDTICLSEHCAVPFDYRCVGTRDDFMQLSSPASDLRSCAQTDQRTTPALHILSKVNSIPTFAGSCSTPILEPQSSPHLTHHSTHHLPLSHPTMPSIIAPPPTPQALMDHILTNAARDNIDLTVLPFYSEALHSISYLRTTGASIPLPDFTAATRIDTHTHPIPAWFRALEPSAAGRDTPSWTPSAHLHFMAKHGIKRSVLSVSTPQANAFAAPARLERDAVLRRKQTIALARLLNEFVAEVCRVWPERFSWLAVTALPYVEESVREVKYALGELGAVGVSVLTSAEGMYPGDERFAGLWEYLEERAKEGNGREVVFIHPTDPVVVLEDGRVVSSRPCKLGNLEDLSFFFKSSVTN